jgi:hypothetical protein
MIEKEERDRLHRQLVRLGDMMGDGLHHEADGKWIEKEYAATFNALYPEVKQKRRIEKNKRVNEQMKVLLETFKCKKCGGKLKQARSGSKIAYCECGLRYSATKKKK